MTWHIKAKIDNDKNFKERKFKLLRLARSSYYGKYLQDLLTVRNSFHSQTLRYFKSLRHYLTRDVLPAESNYRNLLSLGRQNSQDVSRKFSRPTLDELHDENGEVMQSLLAKAKIAPKVNFSFWFLIWCFVTYFFTLFLNSWYYSWVIFKS